LIVNELHLLREFPHSSIISLFEIYENEQYLHIVLEEVNGDSLSTYIKNRGILNDNDIIRTLKRILSVMNLLHEKHIIVRELNPDKVVLS